MQLDNLNDLERLAAASDRLLSAERPRSAGTKSAPLLAIAGVLSAGSVLAAGSPGDWQTSSAILFYSEADRVTAIEPVFLARRFFDNEKLLSAKLVLDGLTGASANGAVPSRDYQTFSRPSGRGDFTTAPGEPVLDDTFRDTRYALKLNWSQALSDRFDGQIGFNASNEYDYLSLSVNAGLQYSFNKNNSQLGLALSAGQDTIAPEGNIPTPGDEMAYARGATPEAAQQAYDAQSNSDDAQRALRSSSEDKSIADVLMTYTQVIDRRTLAQFNYGLSLADGYLTDPFKLVSVVDANGDPSQQLYEHRPDSRTKQSLFFRVKRAFGEADVLDLSYRYMFDDWQINSHTIDARYLLSFGAWTLEPHLRYYRQSAADFSTPFLREGEPLPAHMTADYRLADMQTMTAGVEVGFPTRHWGRWRVAAEYYLQSPAEPDNKPGSLASQTIYPEVDALMLRVNWDFDL